MDFFYSIPLVYLYSMVTKFLISGRVEVTTALNLWIMIFLSNFMILLVQFFGNLKSDLAEQHTFYVFKGYKTGKDLGKYVDIT